MSDRIFFPLVGAAAIAMIALSLFWPQGRSAPAQNLPTAEKAAPPAQPAAPVAPK